MGARVGGVRTDGVAAQLIDGTPPSSPSEFLKGAPELPTAELGVAGLIAMLVTQSAMMLFAALCLLLPKLREHWEPGAARLWACRAITHARIWRARRSKRTATGRTPRMRAISRSGTCC